MVPGMLHSPEMSDGEGHWSEDDTVVPSKFIDESDEDGGWASEYEEAGRCAEPFGTG